MATSAKLQAMNKIKHLLLRYRSISISKGTSRKMMPNPTSAENGHKKKLERLSANEMGRDYGATREQPRGQGGKSYKYDHKLTVGNQEPYVLMNWIQLGSGARAGRAFASTVNLFFLIPQSRLAQSEFNIDAAANEHFRTGSLIDWRSLVGGGRTVVRSCFSPSFFRWVSL